MLTLIIVCVGSLITVGKAMGKIGMIETISQDVAKLMRSNYRQDILLARMGEKLGIKTHPSMYESGDAAE